MKKFLTESLGAFGATVLLLATLTVSSAYGSDSGVSHYCVKASGGCLIDPSGSGCAGGTQNHHKCVNADPRSMDKCNCGTSAGSMGNSSCICYNRAASY
jgi:hypothetical protein